MTRDWIDRKLHRDIASISFRYGRGDKRVLMNVYTVASASFSQYKAAAWEAMGHLAPVSAGI